MKKSTMIILAAVAALVLWCIGAYNGLVTVQEEATQAAADVQSAYQRRADLIGNLVETVKGYAKHEETTLKEVIEARSKATSIKIDPSNCTPEQLQEYQKAQGELGSALGRLIAVSESYPDLKANENFLNLQTQLEGTENRINEARNKYNDKATVYNKEVRSFPNVLFAGILGFRQMEKFAADAEAQHAPKVQF
ncbi:MAG: LemA family protein [Prevotella sp.]|nr:LemA family protein [Prevotella sp.]MBR7054063.1 LemA family protein [Prevotella sp.]